MQTCNLLTKKYVIIIIDSKKKILAGGGYLDSIVYSSLLPYLHTTSSPAATKKDKPLHMTTLILCQINLFPLATTAYLSVVCCVKDDLNFFGVFLATF